MFVDEVQLCPQFELAINSLYSKHKRNGLVLLGLAIVLSQMGRMKEFTVYLFRTYILCGKDFVIDKVGEEPWKMVEAYL